MSPQTTKPLLITFAMLEFVLAAVMVGVFGNVAIGASLFVIGMALIVVAVTRDKKKSNG